MSNDTIITPNITLNQPVTQMNWRARLREVGKEAFIKEEMERLGFWPPNEGVTQGMEEAEAKLNALYPELQAARSELHQIDNEINIGKNIPALIQEIRKKRIERVRAARAVKKQQQAEQKAANQAQYQAWKARTLPYLGHGVSGGLRYEGGNASKIETTGLPPLTAAEDIANAIGITTKQLAWLTYHRGAVVNDHYAHFTIPKRGGGTRAISAPKRQLRMAQKWTLENVLNRVGIHNAAMAFRPRRSIVHNARLHTGKSLVIRVDLKDFFPSIQFRRVKGLFKGLGYNEGVASILALLCTEAPRAAVTFDGQKRHVAIGERCLPQGACTSPALTNILCRRLDARLTGIAQRYGFTYTRYADDLVFSHPDKEATAGQLFTRLRQIVEEEGYVINDKKTRVMRPQHRQVVTGVVVNETPRISRRDLRKFRAFLHHCETEGLQTVSQRTGKNAVLYASGYLSFLHMVSPEQAEKIRQRHTWLTER
jgi:RNA-directed DNA polymerase